MTEKTTLGAVLAVLEPAERVFITHRMGPHEAEAVAGGTAEELKASRCVEVCGDNVVERISVIVDDWPEIATPTLLLVIGGKLPPR